MAAKGGGRKVKEDMLTSSQVGGCNYQQKGHSQMQHGIRLRMTAKLEDLLVNTQHGMQIDGSRLQIMMNTDSNEAKVLLRDSGEASCENAVSAVDFKLVSQEASKVYDVVVFDDGHNLATVGEVTHKGLICHDDAGTTGVMNNARENIERADTLRRSQTSQEIDPQRASGHGPGHNAGAPSRAGSKPRTTSKPRCKCGSTSHQRTTSRDCRLNAANRASASASALASSAAAPGAAGHASSGKAHGTQPRPSPAGTGSDSTTTKRKPSAAEFFAARRRASAEERIRGKQAGAPAKRARASQGPSPIGNTAAVAKAAQPAKRHSAGGSHPYAVRPAPYAGSKAPAAIPATVQALLGGGDAGPAVGQPPAQPHARGSRGTKDHTDGGSKGPRAALAAAPGNSPSKRQRASAPANTAALDADNPGEHETKTRHKGPPHPEAAAGSLTQPPAGSADARARAGAAGAAGAAKAGDGAALCPLRAMFRDKLLARLHGVVDVIVEEMQELCDDRAAAVGNGDEAHAAAITDTLWAEYSWLDGFYATVRAKAAAIEDTPPTHLTPPVDDDAHAAPSATSADAPRS